MIPCPECDRFLVNQEASCPHCAADTRGTLTRWGRLAFAAGATVALTACYGVAPSDSGIISTDSGFVDADLDGFGVLEDCDDADDTVNPDAAETCDDGIDNDCDDLIDGDDDECAEG
ncbi:MAG: hypothetical protein GY913_03080 [Proteobacteria bacterium]|nr:hypothetical protein [Pseudomonadota bacterium]MCP4915883.1 hypothetical protein [Pseudomonadota bacterium]